MPHSAHAPGDATDRIAAAEQELHAFSYMVSHDLAASFRHVAEFSRLLVSDPGGGLSSRQRLHSEFINTAAARCQTMMEQVLAFSQVQQKPLAVVAHDASLTMQRAITQAMARGGEVDVVVTPLGEIVADEKLLSIAFGHMLDNAIKFRRAGTPTRITIAPAHDAEAWRVRISDNGLGVDPAQAEKAFLMFQRLNGESDFPGAGAGLAICRCIARRHGGEVRFLPWADGACIELTLPRPLPSSNAVLAA